MSIKSRIQKSYDKGWTLDEESFKKRLKTICKEFGIPDPEAIQFYSQTGEEKYIIQHILKKKVTDGVFLEIGACDGIHLSTTKTLEDYFGFTGILIEPQKHYFKALKKNRPNCEMYNTAVSSYSESSVHFINANGLAGIKNTFKNDFKSIFFLLKERFFMFLFDLKVFFSYLKQNKFYKINTLKNILKYTLVKFPLKLKSSIISLFKEKISYKVNNIQMREILKKSKFKYIDIMSIDVEGGELSLLESIDFTFPIFCMIIEIADDLEIRKEIHQFLESKGFIFIERQSINAIWVNSNYFRKDLFNI